MKAWGTTEMDDSPNDQDPNLPGAGGDFSSEIGAFEYFECKELGFSSSQA